MITIVTAPQDTKLTTVEKLVSMLSLPSSEDNIKLDEFIGRASKFIENYCGRTFAKTRVKEKIRLDGRDFTALQLTNTPVVEVHAVKYNGENISADDYSLDELDLGRIISAEYKEFFYTGRIYKYEVEYTHGYVLPNFTTGEVDVPADLEQACLQIAKMMYLTADKHPGVKVEEVPEVYRIAYAGGDLPNTSFNATFSDDVKAILQKYKRVKI